MTLTALAANQYVASVIQSLSRHSAYLISLRRFGGVLVTHFKTSSISITFESCIYVHHILVCNGRQTLISISFDCLFPQRAQRWRETLNLQKDIQIRFSHHLLTASHLKISISFKYIDTQTPLSTAVKARLNFLVPLAITYGSIDSEIKPLQF